MIAAANLALFCRGIHEANDLVAGQLLHPGTLGLRRGIHEANDLVAARNVRHCRRLPGRGIHEANDLVAEDQSPGPARGAKVAASTKPMTLWRAYDLYGDTGRAESRHPRSQ